MTVYYENVIGEGEAIPILPANEPERFMLLSGSNTRSVLYLMRGTPGNEYFRYIPVSAEGTTHLQTDGGTTATWGYGFWKSARQDGKYIVVTDNVNSSSAFPFRPFKRLSDGQGYYYEYLGDLAIEPPPLNSQWFYCEYNPVYNEIIVSGSSAGWLIYDDNDDDTFTLATGTYFDVTPLGSGNRNKRGNFFTPDGEMFVNNRTGGSGVQIYQRSTTGARYQLVQEVTGIGNTNSEPMVYDPVRNQILVSNADATKSIKVLGLVSGVWTVVEDLATNNPTWNGSGANQIDGLIDKIHITEDGNYLIVCASRSTGDGHFIFDRAGGQWTLTSTKLANYPSTTSGQNMGFGQIPGTEVVFAGSSAVNAPITFMDINGGAFTEIANSKRPAFGPVQETDKIFQGGTSQFFQVPGKTVVTNPYDPIFLPRNPYMVQTLDQHGIVLPPGSVSTTDTSSGVLVNHPFGSHIDRTAAINFPSNSPDGALFNQPGPIANSYCMVAGDRTYLRCSTPDPDSYIQTNFTAGSMVAVIKTPPAWWTDFDDFHPSSPYARHIFTYGNSALSGSSNRAVGLALRTNGTIGKVTLFFRTGTGTANEGVYDSDVNLDLDTWYVIVINQHADGGGPVLWLNGVETGFTKIRGDLVDTWLSSITINKILSIGSNPGESASLRNPITGMGIAATALFEAPLSGSSIRQLAGSFGVF